MKKDDSVYYMCRLVCFTYSDKNIKREREREREGGRREREGGGGQRVLFFSI